MACEYFFLPSFVDRIGSFFRAVKCGQLFTIFGFPLLFLVLYSWLALMVEATQNQFLFVFFIF